MVVNFYGFPEFPIEEITFPSEHLSVLKTDVMLGHEGMLSEGGFEGAFMVNVRTVLFDSRGK